MQKIKHFIFCNQSTNLTTIYLNNIILTLQKLNKFLQMASVSTCGFKQEQQCPGSERAQCDPLQDLPPPAFRRRIRKVTAVLGLVHLNTGQTGI